MFKVETLINPIYKGRIYICVCMCVFWYLTHRNTRIYIYIYIYIYKHDHIWILFSFSHYMYIYIYIYMLKGYLIKDNHTNKSVKLDLILQFYSNDNTELRDKTIYQIVVRLVGSFSGILTLIGSFNAKIIFLQAII